MSKHDFTAEEFADRLRRVRQAITAAELDWLLVIHPVSMRWLIGQDTKSYTAFQCLPVSANEGKLTIFTREMERNEFEADTMIDGMVTYNGAEPEDPMVAFAKFVDAIGLKNARVGIEAPAYYLSGHHYVQLKTILGDALVAEATGLINSLKLVKSPQEIEYHRKSAAIAGIAYQALLRTVAVGKTELELAGAAYHALLCNGSGIPASTMNLVTGPRSSFSLGGPTERQQQSGDTGLVELGGAFKRYTSTLGRQWVIGEPSDRLIELHLIVRAASDACMAEMRAGAPAINAHEALKKVFVDAGVDQYRQHTSGYGMAPGFPPSWGEPISVFGGSTDVLQAGNVVSVEPGLFLREEGLGVRLIDNCLITDTGIDRLSVTPRGLTVVR